MPKIVKTLSEISSEYGIHVTTLRRWIKPIRESLNLKNRKLLVNWQVELIHKFIEEKK